MRFNLSSHHESDDARDANLLTVSTLLKKLVWKQRLMTSRTANQCSPQRHPIKTKEMVSRNENIFKLIRWRMFMCWDGTWTFQRWQVNKVYDLCNVRDHVRKPTCSMPTISTLLKKMNECRVESMFSSNTEGVGSTMSWMYCTRYVWWIFCRSSGSEMGMTSLKRAVVVRNSRCLRGWGSDGSNSKHPITSMMHSSENMTSKSAVRLRRKMPLMMS